MANKPILFNTEMVKAILEGRKTQTRRIVKPQPETLPEHLLEAGMNIIHKGKLCKLHEPYGYAARKRGELIIKPVKPSCKPGDILWVRETFLRCFMTRFLYKADGSAAVEQEFIKKGWVWKPSIHMPKEAARIFLRVKDVRVERLQEITKQDAISEGISRLFDRLTKAEYEEWANRAGVQVPQHEQPWNNYLWHGHFGVHGMGNRISNAWPWQLSGYANPCGSFSSLERRYSKFRLRSCEKPSSFSSWAHPMAACMSVALRL